MNRSTKTIVAAIFQKSIRLPLLEVPAIQRGGGMLMSNAIQELLSSICTPAIENARAHLEVRLSVLNGSPSDCARTAIQEFQVHVVGLAHAIVHASYVGVPENLHGESAFYDWRSITSGLIWQGAFVLSNQAKRYIPGAKEAFSVEDHALAFCSQDPETNRDRHAADILVSNEVSHALGKLERSIRLLRLERALRWVSEFLKSQKGAVGDISELDWQRLFERTEGLHEKLRSFEELKAKAECPPHIRQVLDEGFKAGKASADAELRIIALKRLMIPERLRPKPDHEARIVAVHEAWMTIPEEIRKAEQAFFDFIDSKQGSPQEGGQPGMPKASEAKVRQESWSAHLGWEAKAIILLGERPTLTATECAKLVGVARATLYKSEKVKMALALRGRDGSIRKGRKSKHGQVEADDPEQAQE